MIGSLLGDARLECRSAGIRCPVSARLRVHHGEKQKDYVFWKYHQLQNLVLREPRRIKVAYDKRRDKEHFSWYFHTQTQESLGALYHYFYRDRVKVVPKNIFDYLTPRALAIWFMDDGSNTKESYTISTHCFSMDDQIRILAGLKEKFNIRATVTKDRTKFKIRIGKYEHVKFNSVIQPYIIPSMTYKICNPRNDLFGDNAGQIRQASLAI